MNTIKPKILQKGDTIGLLTACSPLDESQREEIKNAKSYLESKGFNIEISSTCSGTPNDTEKINAIHEFFRNPKINAIMAARGGYGAIRIVDSIDYNLIRKNPKIFAGFSDITAFQWYLYKKCGLVSFHAPMACPDFGSTIDTSTVNNFFQTVSGKISQIELNPNFSFNYQTEAKGILMPSNLATLASLCGRDFFPAENLILLLEDVNEPEYKIDRMITQILETKGFAKFVKAIVLGKFTDGEDNELNLIDFWAETSQKYKIPICDGAQFGHIKTKITIPFGINAVLNFENQNITFRTPVV